MTFLNDLFRRNQREIYFPIGVSSRKLKQVHMTISSHHSPQHENLDITDRNDGHFQLGDCLYMLGSPSNEGDNHPETMKRCTTVQCYLVLHFYQILISLPTVYPTHYVCCKGGILLIFMLLLQGETTNFKFFLIQYTSYRSLLTHKNNTKHFIYTRPNTRNTQNTQEIFLVKIYGIHTHNNGNFPRTHKNYTQY